jgi:hypothetical protein
LEVYVLEEPVLLAQTDHKWLEIGQNFRCLQKDRLPGRGEIDGIPRFLSLEFNSGRGKGKVSRRDTELRKI